VTPLADPPGVNGPETIQFYWLSSEARDVMNRVENGYQITPPEVQKFGAILLTFFVGLSRG
jgi:hypothetical protein